MRIPGSLPLALDLVRFGPQLRDLLAQQVEARRVGTDGAVCLRAPACCLDYRHPRHRNCGTRGGPGCRREDGKCAYWRDNVTPDCGYRLGPNTPGRVARSCMS